MRGRGGARGCGVGYGSDAGAEGNRVLGWRGVVIEDDLAQLLERVVLRVSILVPHKEAVS